MRRRYFVLTLPLALALAGCGGSSSGTLTHAQLVSKANAICAQRNTQIAALPRSLANPSDAKGTATLLADVIRIDKPLIAQLHALKPPAADKAAWDQALSDNDSIVQIVDKEHAAAVANNGAEFKRLDAQAAPLAQKLKAFESQFGLTECSKQPVPSA